ncbi:MAG: ion transporter [Methylococcaceae bacterium]
MDGSKIIELLDEPKTAFGKTITWLILTLIYFTVITLVLEQTAPQFYEENIIYFETIEYLTLTVFSIEYLIRIIFSKNRFQYITSFYGVIDALSIIPAIFGILMGSNISSQLMRIFKVFRLVRLLKFAKLGNTVGGIVGSLLPFFATVLAFKGVVVVLENQSWWSGLQNLNIVIGVVGFTLAILLGTKLNVVNSRIYAIEDSVCRIVGALRDMQNQGNIKFELLTWSNELEKTLKSPQKVKAETVLTMRERTDTLEEHLESSGIGGPNTAGFHRDVAYLLHRTTAKTPIAYEKFLRYVIIGYILVVVFAVPGMTGFISSILIVYVLGGMYMLIDDMDNPLNYDKDSYITVRLDALEFYNESHSKHLKRSVSGRSDSSISIGKEASTIEAVLV